MDAADYINTRKAKCMAQVLEAIEEGYVALLPPGHDDAVERYRSQRELASAVEFGEDEPRRRSDYEREQGRRAFDDHIIPLLPPGAKAVIDGTKGVVRARIKALAGDAVDLLRLDTQAEINGHALAIRDRLHIGRPEGAVTA